MAEQNVKITVSAEDRASGPIKNVSGAIGTLEKSTSRISSAFSRLATSAVSVGELMASNFATQAVSAISSVVNEMVKLSVEQSKLDAQTKALFKVNSIESYSGALDAVITQHERMTAIDAGSIQKSFNTIYGATKDYDRSLKLLSASEDLAAAKGIDLQTATNQITSALEGSTTMLSKAGVELDLVKMKTMSTAQQMDYLAQQIDKAFGGSAEEFRKTPGGALADFQNQIQNIKQMFGDELIQSLSPAWERISAAITEMIDSGQLQPLVDAFGNLVTNAINFSETLGNVVMKITGVTTAEEGVQKLADSFNRVSYILEVIEDALSRINAIIKDLQLDKITNLGMRALSPLGMGLWDYAGQQVANQKATTPQLQLTKVETRPKATDSAAEALERLREGIRVENESRTKKVENTLATINHTVATQTSSEYLGVLRDRTSETSKQVENLGQTAGGAISFMNDAMNSVRQMLSGGARTRKSSGCGKCPTFTSGERVEAGVDIVYEGPDRGGRGIYTPVPDALITKRGDIVKFHPEDNILAFKDPAAVRGKGGNISVTINVNGSRDPDAIADEIIRRINRITRVGF